MKEGENLGRYCMQLSLVDILLNYDWRKTSSSLHLEKAKSAGCNLFFWQNKVKVQEVEFILKNHLFWS